MLSLPNYSLVNIRSNKLNVPRVNLILDFLLVLFSFDKRLFSLRVVFLLCRYFKDFIHNVDY